jgi:hypothetical protein
MVSLQERKGDYAALRSWFLFGAGPDESPTIFNKIYPHIDQLTSFLYSAETTQVLYQRRGICSESGTHQDSKTHACLE